MRTFVRWLVGLVLVLAVVWSGYWWVGERALTQATERWFARMTAEGKTATYAALDLHGYPSRFDLTLTEPRLGDPATGVSYAAPFVQLLTLSYTPWHVILALPPEQRIEWPGDGATLRSAKMQASVRVSPISSLPLDRFVLVGDGLDARSDAGMAATAETLRLAVATAGEADYRLGLDLLKLAPEGTLRDRLGASGLPAVIDEVRLDAVATLTAPLDRFAAEAQPRLDAVDVKSATLLWGPVSLSATGTVRAGAQGLAEGTMTLSLKGWERAIGALRDAGLIDARTAPTILAAARMMAGGGDGIDLPLTFANGRTTLGIFPLGAAPRLR